jgi:hypothetical protein
MGLDELALERDTRHQEALVAFVVPRVAEFHVDVVAEDVSHRVGTGPFRIVLQ